MAKVPLKFNEMMDLNQHHSNVMHLETHINNALFIGQGVAGFGPITNM